MQLAVEFASNVTIARRLVVLLTVPLVALLGLGVFTRLQLAEIEERSRPLRVVFGQQVAADVDSQFGKPAREIPQRRERDDP